MKGSSKRMGEARNGGEEFDPGRTHNQHSPKRPGIQQLLRSGLNQEKGRRDRYHLKQGDIRGVRTSVERWANPSTLSFHLEVERGCV